MSELYIGTRPTTGGGAFNFVVSEKPTGEPVEVHIGDVPTLEAVEVRAIVWHIAEKIVSEGLVALRKQAAMASKAAA
jgi:hypothetical protein